MRSAIVYIAILSLTAAAAAQTDKTPAAAIRAKGDFDKAVAKAKADLDEAVAAARKELDKQVAEAQEEYLKTLGELLLAETKKGNLDGANAVKAEKDRIAAIKSLDKKVAEAERDFRKAVADVLTDAFKKGGAGAIAKKDTEPKKEPAGGSDKPITLAPKLGTEKGIKEAFELEGDWRIEKDGLKLVLGSGMATLPNLTGDFLLTMNCNIQVDGPHFVELKACGESFVLKQSGNFTIKLDRKGEKLTLRTGQGTPKELVVKDAHKDEEFKVRIHCTSAGPYFGKADILVRSISVTGKPAPEK